MTSSRNGERKSQRRRAAKKPNSARSMKSRATISFRPLGSSTSQRGLRYKGWTTSVGRRCTLRAGTGATI